MKTIELPSNLRLVNIRERSEYVAIEAISPSQIQNVTRVIVNRGEIPTIDPKNPDRLNSNYVGANTLSSANFLQIINDEDPHGMRATYLRVIELAHNLALSFAFCALRPSPKKERDIPNFSFCYDEGE